MHDVKPFLEVHAPEPGKPYYMGVFLVGAYQETLGDLHNLFGDTHVIHVSLDPVHGYKVERFVEGNSVKEVLEAVRYDRRELMRRVRSSAESAVRAGKLDLEDSARLLRRYDESLTGYTYLSGPARVAAPPRREAASDHTGERAAELG